MISVHCFLLLIFLMERIKLHKSVHNILIRQHNAQLYTSYPIASIQSLKTINYVQMQTSGL